ncbi:dihydropteroate synthase [Cryptosporangium sp. NPDC048952]|uniref:dihydropteroate synthase n=1 Tax=Cryptosporangium sp. NPDC048952 TaxID=3363961 RepID=UPI0037226C94
MGVLNVTPDSFSDGHKYLAVDSAVEHGLAMSRSGADIVDVGGESTRPGADRVSEREELARVLPVVRALVESGVRVSIDTTRAGVAAAAVGVGATVINDVSGGLADPRMPRAAAEAGVTYVAMHWRAPSRHMQDHAVYADVVEDVRAALSRRMDALVDAGVDQARIVLDPGLGFAKDAAHNWALLRGLHRIIDLGRPVLVGASRKSFLGRAAAASEGVLPEAHERDRLTAAVTALAADAGAACVRVHDVRSSRDAVTVAAAWHGRT